MRQTLQILAVECCESSKITLVMRIGRVRISYRWRMLKNLRIHSLVGQTANILPRQARHEVDPVGIVSISTDVTDFIHVKVKLSA